MPITKFAIPEVIFGEGSIKYLAPCARRLGAKRILLVSDPGVEEAGWVEVVMDMLKRDALECVYFSEVSSNPRDWQVHKGAELYGETGADVIVGLGGGSPIDAAKGISTIVGNGGRISDYEGANKIMRPLPPMIFIPSTAGSGSDVSQFCIITDMERQVKISIISRSLVPNLSIIDPNLLATKSRELIVASAIDALAHAVESYVSRLASPFSEPQSMQAIRLFMDNIHEAVNSRSPEALKNLSIASTAAGMAFSNAGLGIAHSLAHSIGGRFDVLHGLVHPVLLPTVMRFNLPSKLEKLARVGFELTGVRYKSDEMQALKGIEHLEKLFEDLEATRRLRDLLPDNGELERLCRKALPDACTLTNPREADCGDLMKICEAAW
ncbi:MULTISPECIES: iron-containing alcohol dehydrogenase [unclassified Pseudodesulfovibrio]|uniref:iron-containing alcohol dehydrogenase n=1 Tax=unclassified Pseudodesulfovibrio TaxID=2661612 RepID=UPI000FEB7177|nr:MULTISPECIES: iron-containing alcohol dehydrogenase [unclassified Pseudodesulfovibrio]MCJ2165311.1 iron-containing alcohol dehydrogenase [Pseudodesulfovibrio sp. S3-i]RWU02470.1 iron-containing alcohol dehydrogenase [Pseudodesulfovibrio sp. S3]